MKIYCKTLSNREANRALDERAVLVSEYEQKYAEYRDAFSNYQVALSEAVAKAAQIASSYLNTDLASTRVNIFTPGVVTIRVSYTYTIRLSEGKVQFTTDTVCTLEDVTDIITKLNSIDTNKLYNELLVVFPERPIEPIKPQFTSEDDKDINRQAIKALVKKELWTKVNYKASSRSHYEDKYYIRIRSISETGKKCYADTIGASTVDRWEKQGNDGWRGRNLDRYITRRDLITGNIQIVTPRQVYTTEELEELCAKETTK